MEQARSEGAAIAHFPEGAMSGCSKAQIKAWDGFDWEVLVEELRLTADLARELGLWVVLGSCHRLSSPHRPHNSLYVISDLGEVATRYDKRFLSHTEVSRWYTPGLDHCVFEVAGWRFGCALCIEIQFAEVFQEYAALDVDCVLFSSYADDAMFGIQAQGYAASHSMWVSVAIPAGLSGSLSSRLVGPTGEVQARTSPAVSGMASGLLDVRCQRWEVALHRAKPWRALAREGRIYRPRQVQDPRSEPRSPF